MSTLSLPGGPSLLERAWSVFKREMMPFPGRLDAVWRYVLASAIVILASMTLQVPFLALSLIMVFFTAQENTVLTRKSGIVLMIGATLAIVLSLILLMLTMDYPMPRILGACAIGFCGMYFLRISKLGSIGYLVALWVIYTQSLADLIADPESLVRALLWVWVAISYPIIVTVVVNLLLRPAHPERLLNEEIGRQLDDVQVQLAARSAQTTPTPIPLDTVERGILTLHRHLAFATMGNTEVARDKAKYLVRINTVDRLHTAAAHLSRLPVGSLSPAQQALIARLQIVCEELRQMVMRGSAFQLTAKLAPTPHVGSQVDAALLDMAHALQALADAESLATPATLAAKESLIAADAFSNPVYAQFALKTLLATMLCYVFYNAVQWPGIHTSMLTCIIMALPSLGASSHKGILRAVGCALGSVVTLLATVFIIPQLDSIVGLLALSLPIIAAGAWVAAGSARIGYMGVQFVFAYALASLSHFGPSTDLTEIRDRMVGILIGAGVSVFVFSFVWPEREGDALRGTLAQLLRSIAGLARAGKGVDSAEAKLKAIGAARTQGWSLLAKNREIQSRVILEPGRPSGPQASVVDAQAWFAEAQEALFAVNWLQTLLQHAGPTLPDAVVTAFESFRASAAIQLDALANRLEGGNADTALTLTSALAACDRTCAEARQNEGTTTQLDEMKSAVQAISAHITQLARHVEAKSL